MTTFTVRDLRLKWPAAERALEIEEEIVITRNGRPVAKQIKFPKASSDRSVFDPKQHMAKMRKILGGKQMATIDKSLATYREERGKHDDRQDEVIHLHR